MVKYITSDSNSAITLAKDELYFVDFLVESDAIPATAQAKTLISQSINEMVAEKGHEIYDVSVLNLRPHWSDLSEHGKVVMQKYIIETGENLQKIRIYFRVKSLPIVTLVAIIAGAIAVVAFAFATSYMEPFFVGLGKALENLTGALADVFKAPGMIITTASKNVIPIIAIIVAVSVFILGRKVIA